MPESSLKGYLQQVEHHDDQPSDYPTDGAEQYGDEVDGYVVLKKHVRQEEENLSDEAVDDKASTVLERDSTSPPVLFPVR